MTDPNQTATTTGTDLPEFATLPLSISVDQAITEIHDTIAGLHAAETDTGATIRTTDGRLVAIVQKADSDDADTLFHYRVAPRSEAMTRKAGKLKQALAEFATDSDPASEH